MRTTGAQLRAAACHQRETLGKTAIITSDSRAAATHRTRQRLPATTAAVTCESRAVGVPSAKLPLPTVKIRSTRIMLTRTLRRSSHGALTDTANLVSASKCQLERVYTICLASARTTFPSFKFHAARSMLHSSQVSSDADYQYRR